MQDPCVLSSISSSMGGKKELAESPDLPGDDRAGFSRSTGRPPTPGRGRDWCHSVMREGFQTWVRPMVWSGAGIWPRRLYALTVAIPTPRYWATSVVVHHSASGSGAVFVTMPFSLGGLGERCAGRRLCVPDALTLSDDPDHPALARCSSIRWAGGRATVELAERVSWSAPQHLAWLPK